MDISAEMLGERAFSEATMRARLPKAVFKELKKEQLHMNSHRKL